MRRKNLLSTRMDKAGIDRPASWSFIEHRHLSPLKRKKNSTCGFRAFPLHRWHLIRWGLSATWRSSRLDFPWCLGGNHRGVRELRMYFCRKEAQTMWRSWWVVLDLRWPFFWGSENFRAKRSMIIRGLMLFINYFLGKITPKSGFVLTFIPPHTKWKW